MTPRTKTSVSLPQIAFEIITENLNNCSTEDQIFLCLAKLFKRLKPNELISERDTILYNNEEPSGGKLYLRLSYKNQMLLRYYRMTTGKSASYLIYLAIVKYWKTIQLLSKISLRHNYNKISRFLTVYSQNFTAIDTVIKVFQKNLTVTEIILPRYLNL